MGLLDTLPDKLPRWAYSASNVPAAGASIDPGTAKQSSGFFALEKPSYNTFNWLFSKIYEWVGYLHTSAGTLFDEDFVARGSDCEVTAGGGARESAIAAGKYWSVGAFYEQTATTLTHDQTVTGDARIDTVVGTASGYAIRKGTATTLPTEPTAPSLTAGDVPLEDVRIEFLTVASRTDRREFGAFRQDRLRADTYFRAGDQGGGSYNVEVDGLEDTLALRADVLTTVVDTSWTVTTPIFTLNTSGLATISASDTFGITTTNELYLNGLSGGDVFIGGGTQDVEIGNATGTVTVPAAGVSFPSAVTKVVRLPPCVLQPMDSAGAGTQIQPSLGFQVDSSDSASCHIPIPDGVTFDKIVITATGNSGSTGNVDAALYKYAGTVSPTAVDTDTQVCTPSGTVTLTLDPSNFVFDRSAESLVLQLNADGNSAMVVANIQVTYTTPGITPQ